MTADRSPDATADAAAVAGSGLVILCGASDDEDYDPDGINSPSGKCRTHGFYLYYCDGCHESRLRARRT